MNNHPEITLRLQHSVNDPDFAVEEVDLAIRWGNGGWPDSDSEELIPSPMTLFCSPDLMRGEPKRWLEDLRDHSFLRDQDGTDNWREWFQKAGLADLGSGAGPVIIDPNVRVQSAIDGHGLVLGDILLNDDIANGRLIAPFDIALEGFGFHLLYAPSARHRKAFQLFRQWLLSEAAQFKQTSKSYIETSQNGRSGSIHV